MTSGEDGLDTICRVSSFVAKLCAECQNLGGEEGNVDAALDKLSLPDALDFDGDDGRKPLAPDEGDEGNQPREKRRWDGLEAKSRGCTVSVA
jgi:hypothetical protein